MGIRPLPRQRPIPIWLGGHAEASLRRVAAIGDGWMPLLPPDEGVRRAIARLHSYARSEGRDPQGIGIEGVVFAHGKTPEDWRREVEAWTALGATHLTLYTLDAGASSLAAHLDLLRRFKQVADAAEHG
jgi:alkanesulfonate monooxygenase SsuD/methylene tetrahydromethanopterin reductase-like flavin-dependent oxidoreductase (luciferase family)